MALGSGTHPTPGTFRSSFIGQVLFPQAARHILCLHGEHSWLVLKLADI
jgi:hypothetical protein